MDRKAASTAGPRSVCTTKRGAIASPTSCPHSPGRCWHKGAPSADEDDDAASRPVILAPCSAAVQGAVANAGASRKPSATGGLTRPCARRDSPFSAGPGGRRNAPLARKPELRDSEEQALT